MAHYALLKNVEEMNQNHALDIEDFNEMVFKKFGKLPKFTTTGKTMVVSSSTLSPEDAATLAKVFEILENEDVSEYILETTDGGWLTNDNMNAIVPEELLNDAKELIDHVTFNFDENAWYVRLKTPLFNATFWYIQG